METPEKKAARLALKREKYRQFRENQRATETPEQTAARRAKHNEKERARCQLKLETIRSTETPEQRAARLHIQNEKYKKKRARKLEMETPEQTAARRAKAVEREQRRIKKVRAKETPKQAAERRAEQSSKRLKKRKMKRLTETPEERAARRQTSIEQCRKYNEKVRNRRLKSLAQKSQQTAGSHEEAKTQQDINESCTWSSFGPSESSFSVTTTEGSFKTNTSEDPTNPNPVDTTVVKNEPSHDSWSYYDANQPSFEIREILPDNDYLKPVKGVQLEDHSLFGKLIAESLSKCNRSNTEIDYAKQLIENIMFNLTIGSYSDTNTVNEPETAQSLPTLIDVLQTVIVKEEVDL